MATVLSVFGTRPEAIKMAPIVKAVTDSPLLESVVCVTAQHRGLLDQVLDLFTISADYDLNLMQPGQDLYQITSGCINGLKSVFCEVKPDVVLVHGDTTTAMCAALCAFYLKLKVGHVEAGLRTNNKHSPFPEEMNRKLIGSIADMHFAPTATAKANLLREGIDSESIVVTGNTSIDALFWVKGLGQSFPLLKGLYQSKRLIFMTAHRRENFGQPLQAIFQAVKRFMEAAPEFHLVYPVHPNPNVKPLAHEILGKVSNISLIEPIGYEECVYLMDQSDFILTDSGGLQEEAPSIGKPVLVLRENSERPEVIESGCAYLVGSNEHLILTMMRRLSDKSSVLYESMSQSVNPYGDGTAAVQIVASICHTLGLNSASRRNVESVANAVH